MKYIRQVDKKIFTTIGGFEHSTILKDSNNYPLKFISSFHAHTLCHVHNIKAYDKEKALVFDLDLEY